MAAKLRAAAEASKAAVDAGAAAGAKESGWLTQQQGTLCVSQTRAMPPVKLPPFKLEVIMTRGACRIPSCS
jgi:hypothetical protein